MTPRPAGGAASAEVTHIWLSAHHWPPEPPVVRTYCGLRFVHKKGGLLLLSDQPEKATCPECAAGWEQDQHEDEAMAALAEHLARPAGRAAYCNPDAAHAASGEEAR